MWYIKLLSITCKLILIFVAAMLIVVVGVAIVELVVGAVFVVSVLFETMNGVLMLIVGTNTCMYMIIFICKLWLQLMCQLNLHSLRQTTKQYTSFSSCKLYKPNHKRNALNSS